jgi:S1-C subfamily serine protease
MVVLAVGENTPAERAGLKNGDVVRRVNGKAVTSAEQTKQAIDQALSNNPPLDLRLVVQRGEDTVNLVIPAPKN